MNDLENRTEQIEAILSMLESVNESGHLNKKLLRDMLDVYEGLSNKIFNRKGNYSHDTLKDLAPYASEKASNIRNKKSKSQTIKETHREHAIPLKVLIPELFKKKTRNKIRQFLDQYLKSVLITKEERDVIDKKYKSEMPDSWTFETGDVFERFNMVGIKIEPLNINHPRLHHD